MSFVFIAAIRPNFLIMIPACVGFGFKGLGFLCFLGFKAYDGMFAFLHGFDFVVYVDTITF